MAVVALAIVFIEPLDWRFEPLWGVWNYNGSLVILAPLIAGLSAWDAQRFAGALRLAAARGSAGRVVASVVLPAALGGLIAFAVGGLATVAVLLRYGGLDALRRVDSGIWLSIAPCIAYTCLAVAIGSIIGSLTEAWFATPLVALSYYAVEVALYHLGMQGWVAVGGAAGSLVGLAPNVPRYLSQTLFYASIVIFLAGAAVLRFARRRTLLRFAVAAALPSAALAVLFSTQANPVFLKGFPKEECREIDGVDYCLPVDYAGRIDEIGAAIAPYVAALKAAGVPVSPGFSATRMNDISGQWGMIATSMLTTESVDDNFARSASITGAVPEKCADFSTEASLEAYNTLHNYLSIAVRGSAIVDDSEFPSGVHSPAARERVLLAVDALSTRC